MYEVTIIKIENELFPLEEHKHTCYVYLLPVEILLSLFHLPKLIKGQKQEK